MSSIIRLPVGASVSATQVCKSQDWREEQIMKNLWQDKPDSVDSIPNFRLLRTPCDRKISGIIVSSEHVGAKIHYWKGRSKPCRGETCEACEAGQIPRWKGYILLYDPKLRTQVVFEFTERVYPQFQMFLQIHKTLRGGQMTAGRLNRKPNGPLLVTFDQYLYDQNHLPQESNLRDILSRIWEITPELLEYHDDEGQRTPSTNGLAKI